MNKYLLIFLILILGIGMGGAQNSVFHEQDKGFLRKFLRQPSAKEGVYNFQVLGLQPIDTLYWDTSED